MLRRFANWLLTLGGSWHPVRVVIGAGLLQMAQARCRCGYEGIWRARVVRAQQDAYDHQAMGGRA